MGGWRAGLTLVLWCVGAAAAAADTAPAWPRTFTQNGNQLVVSQPQLDAWTNRLAFTGRAAALLTAQGGTPLSGVLFLSADTDTDVAQRSVTLHGVQISRAEFPGAAPAAAAEATALAKSLLPANGLSLSLDSLLAALVQSGQSAASVPLNTAPPTIFLAGQPSRLVLFDGPPRFAPVAGTTVQRAVNTNWPLLLADGAYYLLDASGWLRTDALATGEWPYTSQLPAAFAQLPSDADWQAVRAQIPAPPSEGQPPLQVFVSSTPAELIELVGEPQYQKLAGTTISAITNTDSLVFWDGSAAAYYYLVAGRWFTAPALAGPWTYATRALPADLATIPAASPLAAVLPSVPGTPEAREAALQAQIPHLATVDRRTATATVSYDGAPQFAPVDGTSLAYAVNTGSDVLRVGDRYYLCQNGVWFVAAAADGPWSVAATVPEAIYTIPPNSPLYHVTYVRVYDATDDAVQVGYTDGYLGQYVSDGVVTWGTGYYYPPWFAADAAARYYPRPYTYGCDAYYNPLSGRFHRAGYGYGPGGGIAGAGYAPVGAGIAPAGGAPIAAGLAPVGAGIAPAGPALAAAYNPRTAARANPYAAWDQAVVYGPRRAAQAETVSGGRGDVTRVQTSGGAEAVAVSDGDRQAAAVRAPGGDWYAGGDGGVYTRGDAGWQRVDAPRAEAARPAEEMARPQMQADYGAVNRELDQAYAVRQRELELRQRYAGWGQRDFGGFAGGRYGGGGGRGGGRR